MRVFLVGEAARHEADLRSHLDAPHELVALPAEAAEAPARTIEVAEPGPTACPSPGPPGTATPPDARTEPAAIGPDDVVVSLRWRRQGLPFRLLQVPGAGLDRIDLAALHPGTSVANVYEHEIPIAEYVLARLLEWEIRAEPMRAEFSASTWPLRYPDRVPHGELYGRTLGILGFGRIGRAIAARAAAFGVRVLGIDPSVGSSTPAATGAALVSTDRLNEVLPELDYLVVACPLTPRTEAMVDAELLRRLPAHAVLVNVSRAEVVDQHALYTALTSENSGIGGAVLDVWYRYPSATDPAPAPAALPFWELPNAWCTPHSSGWSSALSRRRYAVIAQNINRLAAGRPLLNLVRAGKPDS